MIQLECCPQRCTRENGDDKIQIFPSLLTSVSGIGLGVADRIKMNLALNSAPKLEISRRFSGILRATGIDQEDADTIGNEIASDIANASLNELPLIGTKWLKFLQEKQITESIDHILMQRNLWVAGVIASRLLTGTVLDHDSGDSYVADEIQKQRSDINVKTCDSYDFRRDVQDLPFALYEYDKKELPYIEGEFDNAIMATVLHHCDEPEQMFDEVVRKVRSGGRIFVLENTFHQGDSDEQKLNVIFDWIFNSIIHETVLPLPFSHFCMEEWEYFLTSKGLKIMEKLEMGHHPSIPLNHVLYVVEKR